MAEETLPALHQLEAPDLGAMEVTPLPDPPKTCCLALGLARSRRSEGLGCRAGWELGEGCS